ncbi:phosphoglycerate mutase-like protein [Aaosphaeria arxii CBS 175.79]|uniref:Phosphoglycerate mutase-like protein n=1 Tax=Aaosphaeria arxii CBS 175.79 TaxID=1450172 RepID=A0A6A5Y262_9PLEO|nr:phosphoglycerate mutase-like protein [Aaosphaeria arxii CBS 175.79]KAF2018920.1 phosphoglycerate mutase-like protein [Aaosphaeria arxii CBS 175.79]
MFALPLALMATAWLVEAEPNNEFFHPHAVVAFIRTGEKTPQLLDGPTTLTNLGAQQMYRLGQLFRGRYIDAASGDTAMGEQPLPDISPNIVDSQQLFIRSLDIPNVFSSAQAFMQGLYPPYKGNATNSLNETDFEMPLAGYQYAQIDSLSPRDPMSIYIGGEKYCPTSRADTLMYEVTDAFQETRMESREFYESLSLDLLSNTMTESQLDYYNAEKIYEYILYRSRHEQTIRDQLSNGTILDTLRYYTDLKAWYSYGNTSSSTSDQDYRAMAGRTLAAQVLGKFQEIVRDEGSYMGSASPLSLMFGDYQPFVSFFSLAMLDEKHSNFMAMPDFASTMIFELYSRGRNSSFPENATTDLYVRFRFQNGTDYKNNDIQSFVLFNKPNAEGDMTWPEFENMMSRIMVNEVADWCEECSSNSQFCWGATGTTVITRLREKAKSGLAPAVAGVIGAIVTLVVAGLIFAAAMFLGGVRFHRVERGKRSDLGGFKGSAKLASDPDLHLPSNAAAPAGIVVGRGADRKTPHERVGSWELRQKEFGPRSGDIGDESRRESFEAIEAAMARPVEPNERV